MSRAGDRTTRDGLRASEVPDYYVWWLHVGALVLSWLATIALCAWQLDDLASWHWSFLVAGMVLSYSTEYLGHRFPFHHKWGGPLFYRHTIVHHSFFSVDNITVDGNKDLLLVLLPAYAFLLFAIVLAPLMLLLGYLVHPNAAWMIPLGVAAYYPFYEIPHAASHLASETGFWRHRFWHAISLHHRLHHAPQLAKYNFSFGIPFADQLFGTYKRMSLADAIAGASEETNRRKQAR